MIGLLLKSYDSVYPARVWPHCAIPALARISGCRPHGTHYRPKGASLGLFRISLTNQNLLYMVFRCQVNTNRSGSRSGTQALFGAQNGVRKTTTKTDFCGASGGRSTIFPLVFHRFVHHTPVFKKPTNGSNDVAVLRHWFLRRKSWRAGARTREEVKWRSTRMTASPSAR